jgi:Protein of unknown function (DUF3443)/Cep192 domain 4
MTKRNYSSTARLCGALALIGVVTFMSGCGSGRSSPAPTPTTPGASLSPSTLTFTSQTVGTPSAGQTVMLTSSGTGTLTLSSIAASGDFAQTNNCAVRMAPSTNCVINVIFTPTASGTRTGTLTVTDNASNSPQTVSLSGSSPPSTVSLSTSSLIFAVQTMVGTSTAAQSVTVANIGTQALTITSISANGDYSETDDCGGSLSVGANCTINITFTPTATGARNGSLTITDDSNSVPGSMQTVDLTGSGFTNNAVAVSVNFGPNDYLGPPTATTSSYYNGIFTTVTVCTPGTSTCTTIPDVLVDTGSVGLRVLSNIPGLPTQVADLNLPSINDGAGDDLFECVEYGDTSYSWGPVQLATVKIGGETASETPGFASDTGVPIQVIDASSIAPTGSPCLSGNGPPNNSVTALGANGILGIANFDQDCGSNCTTSTTVISPYPYILCPSSGSSSCSLTAVPLDAQVWNPVSAFASADNNGVVLQLPSIPAAGQLTVAGTLIFGIETETCPGISPPDCYTNALGAAQIYALDSSGSFASILFNGLTYLSTNNPIYLDSGSQALFISDAGSLGISDCIIGSTNIGLYCPGSSPLPLTGIVLTDNNGVKSPAFSLSIANALTLFNNNPSFAAFNNLGGDSGTGPSNDSFDFGLPFHFGRKIYVGIEGTTPPKGVAAPNGYYAF